jgi:NADH-quinone oxidoreductase subunit L
VAGSQKVYEGFDLKIIDGAVNGVGKFVRSVAAAARVVQTGYVRNYALTILAGVVLVVGYYLWI